MDPLILLVLLSVHICLFFVKYCFFRARNKKKMKRFLIGLFLISVEKPISFGFAVMYKRCYQ